MRVRAAIRWAALSVIVAATVSACAATTESTRQPVPVLSFRAPSEGVVELNVAACDARTKVESLVESESEVRVLISALVDDGDGPGCSDVIEITLETPLANRVLIDEATDRTIAAP